MGQALLGQLPQRLRSVEVITKIVGNPKAVIAVADYARPFVCAGLAQLGRSQPLLIVTPTANEAQRLHADLSLWLPSGRVDLFPAWETLPFERVSPAVETMGQRMRTIWHLRHHRGDDDNARVIVAPVKAVLQQLGPHIDDVQPVTIRPGDAVDSTKLVEQLVAMGYRRDYQVEARGDVAVRGSIVDVYPSTADAPVRLDLWGDEVDRLTTFTLSDQRSIENLDSVEFFACRELLATDDVRDRARQLLSDQPWGAESWERIANGATFDGMESWLPWLTDGERVLTDLLPDSASVIFVEPKRMFDRAKELRDEEEALAGVLSKTWGATRPGAPTDSFPRLHVAPDRLSAHVRAPIRTMVSVPESPDTVVIEASRWSIPGGDTHAVATELTKLVDNKVNVVVVGDTHASASRMAETLRGEGARVECLDETGGSRSGSSAAITVLTAPMEYGFILPDAGIGVITESDITGRRRSHRKPRPRASVGEGFFDDLSPGDFVVHHHHGVGKYSGMVRRSIGGTERDYLLLEYRGGDKLYVPSDQIDAIRPYTGGETPSVHRLGGSDFARTKARVRSAVDLVAAELVVLYQKRVHAEGHAYGADTPWQTEMEAAFPFTETRDQLVAIEAVKADMEREAPMDRLICGDVGFGKTEVAIRACFKAVQDGKQVAVLVPTTLLAQQHFTTFSERFAGYPIRVEVLSRFLTAAQAREVINAVNAGEVDIVIGTHMLLSKDVSFKRLGLLVLDEEQRFGVSHKDAIKKLQTNVDVLTLSATPIPRTLEMSLTGIRDLTILNTPPADRQPILTYVGEWDERAISEAIRRELLREGQVFYVHNRVADIERTAAQLRALVPEARIGVAHGQMDEGSLEQVVIDFWQHNFDVLVCTTIIESGIDMPMVNTLVVDRADRLGLAQLHQLRGRVGRAGQRAYAYLFYPPDVTLTESAYERLKTIGENTALGSGFKIAMRDLEIRGAGNLLGGDQSGHIAAVGYDLYVQMVHEAVAELKGEPLRPPAEIKLELPQDAHLPTDYVAREDVRLEAYRRLAQVENAEMVSDIRNEWIDRFGPIPPEAEALLEIARLRSECVRLGVTEVAVAKGTARISPLTLTASQQMRLKRLHPAAIYKEDSQQVVIPLPSAKRIGQARVVFTSAKSSKKKTSSETSAASFLFTMLSDVVPNE